MLTELRGLLETGRYRPQAVRRVYLPKPGRPKERRPLGIPRVRHRVVQTAARLFEASFLLCSFAPPLRGPGVEWQRTCVALAREALH